MISNVHYVLNGWRSAGSDHVQSVERTYVFYVDIGTVNAYSVANIKKVDVFSAESIV